MRFAKVEITGLSLITYLYCCLMSQFIDWTFDEGVLAMIVVFERSIVILIVVDNIWPLYNAWLMWLHRYGIVMQLFFCCWFNKSVAIKYRRARVYSKNFLDWTYLSIWFLVFYTLLRFIYVYSVCQKTTPSIFCCCLPYVSHSIYSSHAPCCCLFQSQEPWNTYTATNNQNVSVFFFFRYFSQWWISAPLQFTIILFCLCCQDFTMTKRTWYEKLLVFINNNLHAYLYHISELIALIAYFQYNNQYTSRCVSF